jgi:hypothetical protein
VEGGVSLGNGSHLALWDPFEVFPQIDFKFLGFKPPLLPSLRLVRASRGVLGPQRSEHYHSRWRSPTGGGPVCPGADETPTARTKLRLVPVQAGPDASTFGISALHKRNASPVHACRPSGV